MSADPCQVVFDALLAHGCRPKGRPYNFRARCPVHGADGGNPLSLHVQVGADGRCVLWCFAHGCTAESITSALGLGLEDLFEDGHRSGHRFPLRPIVRRDFVGPAAAVANALLAFERLGERWDLMLATDCPYCGAQGAWLKASLDGVDVDCPGEGCDVDRYVGALLGRLQTAETSK